MTKTQKSATAKALDALDAAIITCSGHYYANYLMRIRKNLADGFTRPASALRQTRLTLWHFDRRNMTVRERSATLRTYPI